MPLPYTPPAPTGRAAVRRPGFVLPVDWSRRKFTLNWNQASQIDWGTVILFGGGLVLGDGDILPFFTRPISAILALLDMSSGDAGAAFVAGQAAAVLVSSSAHARTVSK